MSNPLKLIKPFIVKYEPEILMATGISGLLFSTAWAIKATFTVSKRIHNYKVEHNCEKLTPKEYFKLCWKDYLPVVISTGLAIPCVICGNRVSSKRYAALATAYTISETAFQEYREQTRNLVGEKKAQQIQEAANEEAVKRTSSNNAQVVMTKDGNYQFFEPISGRYLLSNWNKIQKAANDLNARAIGDVCGYITLNEWFEAIGLEETLVGNDEGWSLSDNNGSTLIDISISSHIGPNNEPCGAISYRKYPSRFK